MSNDTVLKTTVTSLIHARHEGYNNFQEQTVLCCRGTGGTRQPPFIRNY